MTCFIEYDCAGKKEKEFFPSVINLKTIKHAISVKKFTGQVQVFNGKICWDIACQDGVFNGICIKYVDYVPSTFYGSLRGYLSFNWRQVAIIIPFRNGLIDGQVLVNKEDGSKNFVLQYSMGLLDGEQKHYTAPTTRVIHTYKKGKWQSSAKQYKNWVGANAEIDEINSHKALTSQYNDIVKLI